jgi:hypothetical protein
LRAVRLPFRLRFVMLVRAGSEPERGLHGAEGDSLPRCDGGPKEAGVDVTDVWIANDEGTEIVRARDIAGVSLDYDGNVTVRLAGTDGAVMTIAGHRTHHEERRPGDFHRQLVRVVAELSDAAGPFLVRAVHHETRGWQWVSEPL